jgi:hypothetical protein
MVEPASAFVIVTRLDAFGEGAGWLLGRRWLMPRRRLRPVLIITVGPVQIDILKC